MCQSYQISDFFGILAVKCNRLIPYSTDPEPLILPLHVSTGFRGFVVDTSNACSDYPGAAKSEDHYIFTRRHNNVLTL